MDTPGYGSPIITPTTDPQTLADQVNKSLGFSTPVGLAMVAIGNMLPYYFPKVPSAILSDWMTILMVFLFTGYTIFRFYAQKKV